MSSYQDWVVTEKETNVCEQCQGLVTKRGPMPFEDLRAYHFMTHDRDAALKRLDRARAAIVHTANQKRTQR